MPSVDEHQEKYLHNKKLLSSDVFSKGEEFADWHVTILFYEAVHLIERELAKQLPLPFHSKDHTVRIGWVTRTTALNSICKAYVTIYIQSRRARYDCVKFTKQDIINLEKQFTMIEDHLNQMPA